MEYFIDTNVFLKVLIREDDKIFAECFHPFKIIKEKKVSAFTSSLVIAEVHWTLLSFYQIPKKEVTEALKSIINLRELKITDNFNVRTAINLYEDYSVKFIDALIASIPKIFKREMAVVSYDNDVEPSRVL